MSQTLIKQSAIAALFRSQGARIGEVSGWQVAEHFGNPENEKQHLQESSILVDWSHIDKISLRGHEAVKEIVKTYPSAGDMKPLQTCATGEQMILRLMDDEFLILDQPGKANADLFDGNRVSVINQSGSLACLVLAGPQRDEVVLRSSAMNTRRDVFAPGRVVQTTVHGIGCIYYRTETLDLFLPMRDFAQSLYEAFLDVGKGVGLIPAGITTLPVKLK